MFYGDIRTLPKISLNVNLVRLWLEDTYEFFGENDDDEIPWSDKDIENITRVIEERIALRIGLGKSVSAHEIFMDVPKPICVQK
jgi:hypothetical protein